MAFPRSFALPALALLALPLNGCGVKLAASSARNGYARAIVTDASMREVLNRKWSCAHSENAAAGPLPYRKLTILNDGETQALQLAIHYADTTVPTVDLVQTEQLDCAYSTADGRVLKCGSRLDPTFRLETTVSRDPQGEILTVTFSGAESTFAIYFGGKENRLATLAEFRRRYPEPFQIRLSAPEACGFAD